MHTGHYYDLIVNNSVVKTIWEPPQMYTTSLAINNREAFGVAYQGFNDGIYRYKKFVTKIGSLSLIPSIGFLDICSSRRAEDR
jgi:hypothetical protein